MTILISGKLHRIISESRIRIHPDQPKPKKGEKVKPLPVMYYTAVKTEPIKVEK